MEWITRMNAVIDYIEDHLRDQISYDEISRTAACPPTLLQRFFIMTTDVPMSEYIRRRRLTCAAYDLQRSDEKIIDIAFKYGYESSDAFCVAFKRLHGVTPSAARHQNTCLKSYLRLSFTLSIKGDIEMNYRVVERNEFKVAGKIVRSSLVNNIIPQFWEQCKQDGTVDKLLRAAVSPCTLGFCFGYDEEGNNDYMVAAETLEESVEGMQLYTVPKSTWLVFEAIGPLPKKLGETWKRIYGEFLPQSVYTQSALPTIEVYFGNDTSAEDYKVEIWIPVTKS